MRRFNWESFVGSVIAVSIFGYAYGRAVPDDFKWWVAVLFGLGLAMMRAR